MEVKIKQEGEVKKMIKMNKALIGQNKRGMNLLRRALLQRKKQKLVSNLDPQSDYKCANQEGDSSFLKD